MRVWKQLHQKIDLNACITHNHIKPASILYKVSQSQPTFCQFKLTHFGLSKVFLEGEEPISYDALETRMYCGPEVNNLRNIRIKFKDNVMRTTSIRVNRGYDLVKDDIHQLDTYKLQTQLINFFKSS